MLQVSDAYKELVKSNIRPKCEPIIKVSGVDNNGNDIELVWNAKNIKDLNYKRGIDPVGRELPYMELTWTEIYTGKLNSESYPEKYNNITKYMQVELSFVQDLGFYNTWKSILNRGLKWKDLLSKTWKQVEKETPQEKIVMPKLFLNARPIINGQTITWVAKDLLSFAIENQGRFFEPSDPDDADQVTLKNAISYFTINAKGSFLNARDLFDAYMHTVDNLLNDDTITEIIDKMIICEGATNNIILNLASVYNYYIDFKDDIFVLKKYNPQNADCVLDKKVLYAYPKIENTTNISAYDFKFRIAEYDEENEYYKKPVSSVSYYNEIFDLYTLNGFGKAFRSNPIAAPTTVQYNFDGSKMVFVLQGSVPEQGIYVLPINNNDYNEIVNIDDIGETFYEDNPINPYNFENNAIKERITFLTNYFSNSATSLSLEALPNLSIETNDVVLVDTNLFDEFGEQISKKALVVYNELEYRGSLKQKIKAHEVII